MSPLAGRVALVVGGGRGIGRANALALAVYLASESARFVTGQVFVIDGGHLLPTSKTPYKVAG